MRGPSVGIRRRCPCNLQNHPAFPQIAGRDGLASDCQHSHLVAGLRLSPHLRDTLPKKPGIAPPSGGRCLGPDARESALLEKRRAFPSLSLSGISGGHTCEKADGRHHQPSIMMCVELRIRCSQPPSRGFSGSLATFAKSSRRSHGIASPIGGVYSLTSGRYAHGRSNALSLKRLPSVQPGRIFPCAGVR